MAAFSISATKNAFKREAIGADKPGDNVKTCGNLVQARTTFPDWT
jgi:hypothetical protein